MKIINIVGARPNFMKIAPLMRAYQAAPSIEPLLVHTGQHYDHKMSQLFFEELGIPRPDIDLEVGSGSHAVQTAEIMKRFEPVCLERKPDMVLVVGDVNSTIACALVAAKLGIKVAHVEAGLRSFDRAMPEEINRVLTDAISDLLFVSEPSGVTNLKAEGVPDEKVHLVGNVMIDTLLANLEKAKARNTTAALGLTPKAFALVTLHRPSNVDDPTTFKRIWSTIVRVAERTSVVFPVHPRTRARMETFGLLQSVASSGGAIRLLEPQGYLEFLGLMADASVVLTDSGGIQEETTILGTPCVTLRENTERPVTCEVGGNRLVGTDAEKIWAGFVESMRTQVAVARPPLWDGKTAERIVRVLAG
ncbi:MAG: UDP-2,3-diacetamido-2,3-dideoxy-D-glucuronate 2-epimerase [Phycisphaerae bacterium]|nr:UDP-2,3-diacetamido-2,3-dideoxy-D-glucuronate 2-epimerase [Phycisphaerae bacterium]